MSLGKEWKITHKVTQNKQNTTSQLMNDIIIFITTIDGTPVGRCPSVDSERLAVAVYDCLSTSCFIYKINNPIV